MADEVLLGGLTEAIQALSELERKHPQFEGKARACAAILAGLVPSPGTYAANVIEGLAHRIRSERQSINGANR